MIVLDALAALAIAVGGFLGARRGFWRIATGAGAVGLGALVGWLMSGFLGGAFRAIGVGGPGDAILGFFVPFALVSIYVRYLAGLWLSKMLEERPEGNRALGSLTGAVWMVFAVGSVGRLAGLGPQADSQVSGERERSSAPFVSWLAKYPGAVGSYVYSRGLGGRDESSVGSFSRAVTTALDSGRVHSRTREADKEAAAGLRGDGEQVTTTTDTSGPTRVLNLR